MENLNFSTYKYSKKTKTSYKLVSINDNAITGDTQIDLPNSICLTDYDYIKYKSNNKANYFISQGKKHISKLMKFDNADFFFGDILKDKIKYLLIAKINETDLDIYLFNNENAIKDKLKSLEIVKNEIA